MKQYNQRPSGFECPVCKGFIPISVTELIKEQIIVCPQCDLKLSINHAESQKAIKALEKVQQAQADVERASVFRR